MMSDTTTEATTEPKGRGRPPGRPEPQREITLNGERLLIDQAFRDEKLAGCSQRTGSRYDARGLPFVMIRGFKYRPVERGCTWIATNIIALGQPAKRAKRTKAAKASKPKRRR
jgi:hypothetical protein